ncbi:MAG: hypothetical protein V3R92_03380 [Dehalococcoidales bacterium]
MAEIPEELRKLAGIAADLKLPADLRTRAIEQLGIASTHDALIALLELAANEALLTKERDLALKKARDVVKRTSPS